MSNLRESALRFSEHDASESGFRRDGSRATEQRPRASLLPADFLSTASKGIMVIVYVHRFAAGVASFSDLRGPLARGSGYARQCAARLNALRQLLVTILLVPVLSSEDRGRVVAPLVSARDQTSKFLCKGGRRSCAARAGGAAALLAVLRLG